MANYRQQFTCEESKLCSSIQDAIDNDQKCKIQLNYTQIRRDTKACQFDLQDDTEQQDEQ